MWKQPERDEYVPCGYSLSDIWAFDSIENKHSLYQDKSCMKKFCNSLREQAQM